ncbi:hypothetical protein ACNF40_00870 [Cuniculiplasma sp. SKW4]|uniref:hypothetical protein n=1 Tax=Cuniculiplasma sp. SKW4 TaxID=3400171 RepID=UPI003FD21E83
MASDVEDIIRKMMKNSPGTDFKKEWTLGIANLWGQFGSKKYIGKKGMKLLNKTMQDTYVMMGSESDKMKDIRNEITKLSAETDEMAKVKLERARDQLTVSEKRFSDLHLRYKFLSTIYALQDISNGSKFIKKIDSIVKNRKVMDIIKEQTKSDMVSFKEIERDLDSIDVYLDIMKDGHATDIRIPEEDEIKKVEEKKAEDEKEEEDGDVMLS